MSSESSGPTQIFVGTIIHCKSRGNVEYLDNGFVIVMGSKIVKVGLESGLNEEMANLRLNKKTPRKILTESQFLMPGLVDVHLHASQYPTCGVGYSRDMLDWLHKVAYPMEVKFSDEDYSRKVYNALVKRTVICGTTTACYYGSLYNTSCNILVDTVIEHGQRAFIGKVNMIKGAPDNYIETPEESIANTIEFIKYVQSKKNDLIKPIISPRFALTVDIDLMIELSSLAKCLDLPIQTHISENIEIVEEVEGHYRDTYALIYDKAHLLTPKTILAHALFLTDDEIKLIARRGSTIAHCPDANLCLKSGNCPLRQLWDHGITVGLGSDVSAGSHPSIIKIMKLCLYTSTHFSYVLKDYVPFTYEEVFYLGTLGGSEVLSLQKQIGNFEENKDFDAIIVDMDVPSGIDYFQPLTPTQLLSKFIYSGDDRNLIAVYIAGKLVKSIDVPNK